MAKNQAGHDTVTTMFVELVAIALFAILAGMSDDVGRVMLVFMWGLVILWGITHTTELATMVKAL